MFEKLKRRFLRYKRLERDDCQGCVIAREEVRAGARAAVCQKCLCVWLCMDAAEELNADAATPPND